MRTIVLPGYSLKNKDWAYEVRNKLQGDVEVAEWAHWSDENEKWNPQKEAERIASKVGEETVNIIAKSLGTLVACFLIPNIKVNKIIFCGIPLNDMGENDYSQYKILSKLENIIIFQNDNDAHGNFLQVKEFVGKINSGIKIIEKIGDTHDYPYYEDFKKFLG
ncbi:MAG TPA: hypothetical protein VLE44_01200 [Candidatus Saccharimonadales bacterium]|nr:hypothetical protein [Candidatus Saccharimonadales bacterium]